MMKSSMWLGAGLKLDTSCLHSPTRILTIYAPPCRSSVQPSFVPLVQPPCAIGSSMALACSVRSPAVDQDDPRRRILHGHRWRDCIHSTIRMDSSIADTRIPYRTLREVVQRTLRD